MTLCLCMYRVSRRIHPSKFGGLSTNKANLELTRGSLSDFQLPYAFRDSPVNIYLFSYKPSRPSKRIATENGSAEKFLSAFRLAQPPRRVTSSLANASSFCVVSDFESK